MKILFNTMNLGKGGAERVISILANEFIKNNDVKIIMNLNMPIEYNFDERIEIVSIEKKHSINKFKKILSRISFLKLNRLRKEVIKFKPDIIISFLPEPSFRLLILKKYSSIIRKIPVVVSVRNDPNIEYNNFIYKFIMKKLYPYANQLVLQTKDSQSYFQKEIKKKGVVIYNPVSDVFLNCSNNNVAENKFIAVGRLENQKDYFTMIDAFKIFLDKSNSDYKLEIYGDGTQREAIKLYITKLQLENKVLLMGKTSNVKEKMQNCKAFVMSSIYEGMPNSLLEAMCLGIPCISTDCPCGGPREILDYGNCGFLVPVKSSKKLSEAMLNITNNSVLLKKFKNNSKEHSKIFSTKRIIEEWKLVLKEQIKGED